MMISAEMIAVLLSILYLVFALRENPWCWFGAFTSSCIFVGLFFNAHFYMQSALQIYYAGMAIYGAYQWQYGGVNKKTLSLSYWPIHNHFFTIIAVLILSVLSGFVLAYTTQATHPFLDSLVTWGSLIATYLLTQKIIENWLYWIVLDSVALSLYIDQKLFFTAGLFCLYVALAIVGFYQWHKKMKLRKIID